MITISSLPWGKDKFVGVSFLAGLECGRFGHKISRRGQHESDLIRLQENNELQLQYKSWRETDFGLILSTANWKQGCVQHS